MAKPRADDGWCIAYITDDDVRIPQDVFRRDR